MEHKTESMANIPYSPNLNANYFSNKTFNQNLKMNKSMNPLPVRLPIAQEKNNLLSYSTRKIIDKSKTNMDSVNGISSP
jgi:hypothetical protein